MSEGGEARSGKHPESVRTGEGETFGERAERLGGEARNHEAEVEALRAVLGGFLPPGDFGDQLLHAALDAVRRSPQGEDHEARDARNGSETMPEFDEAGIGVAARAMFDFHHGGAADYDPNFAWDDLDDSARDYWQQLAEAALSRCPSPVSGTEPPPIDEDAAYWRQKYEEALHLADPVKIMLGVERILLDDGREFVLAPVSGTEPDTAKLARAEAILRVIAGRVPVLDAADASAMRERARSYFAAGFSVDAGKPEIDGPPASDGIEDWPREPTGGPDA